MVGGDVAPPYVAPRVVITVLGDLAWCEMSSVRRTTSCSGMRIAETEINLWFFLVVLGLQVPSMRRSGSIDRADMSLCEDLAQAPDAFLLRHAPDSSYPGP